MSGLIEQLRHRVEETRREVEAARKKAREAQVLEEILAAELAGYEKALAAEERREGKVGIITEVKSLIAETPTPVGKTAFADNYIKVHNGTGVTARELYKAFRDAGIELHRNYIYSMLSRLVAKGRIRERRGKYFPAESTATGGSGGPKEAE